MQRTRTMLCWLARTLMAVSIATAFGAVPVVDDSLSPHAAVQSIGVDQVRWEPGFWSNRFHMARTVTVPALLRLMEGTNHSQFLRNFEIAAGEAEGRHRGAPFNDGEVYKVLEAASALVAAAKDSKAAEQLDGFIGTIAKAQQADGYLHTPVLIAKRSGDTNTTALADRNHFEVYNFGHLMTAGCLHYRATGKTNLLNAALRAAGYVEQAFANPTPELARNAVCPSHYMGLVELYRTTRDARWLELATKLFGMRDLVARSGSGGDDNQDRVPFLESVGIVGHAVRANYLYAGAADLFLESGDEHAWKVLSSAWTNLVQQKLYITGGCGALYDGASPDGSRDQKQITRVHQSYGRNYQLPNTTAHNETCASIGLVLWSWRMFLASGEAGYIDTLEQALYNTILAGVSLEGTNFFYTNPLRVTQPLPVELRWPRTRVPYLSSFCCPPNLARTLSEVSGYVYGKNAGGILVNLFAASSLDTPFNGQRIRLIQETEYPWNGRVRVRILDGGKEPWGLKIRVPGWSRTGSCRLNLGPGRSTPAPGTFLEIRRKWTEGDVLDLDFPMDMQVLESHPLVEETLGQVAIRRGPLVYCLESADLPSGSKVMDVRIPQEPMFRARYDQRLLGGVVLLEGTAWTATPTPWQGNLYRTRAGSDSREIKTRLVPYYAWGNREPGEMSVWLQPK